MIAAIVVSRSAAIILSAFLSLTVSDSESVVRFSSAVVSATTASSIFFCSASRSAAYFSNMFAMAARPPLIIYIFVQLYTMEAHLSRWITPLTCCYSFGNPAASRTVPTRASVAFAALPRRSNSTTDLPAAPA